MRAKAVDMQRSTSIVPFSLKDAPSLIERIWPAQKISVETQKERKAGPGQTLTALGSYWKGRKPLFLVRACILGALLPSTGDDEGDLALFEALVGMDDRQVPRRFKVPPSTEEIIRFAPPDISDRLLDRSGDSLALIKLPKKDRSELLGDVVRRMPYKDRVDRLLRPEEVGPDLVGEPELARANERLGTTAKSLSELVEQLGIMRFGRRPKVGDSFSGGGSIPFEAARTGCDVYASDLNPIAGMLTWGAFNLVGASEKARAKINKLQHEITQRVLEKINSLRVEEDELGNRAKAYLYCLEVKCPQTGWLVPMLGTMLISAAWKVIAKLEPIEAEKRFNIKIVSGASALEIRDAAKGTVRDGCLVYDLEGETYSSSIKDLRGDRKGQGGVTINNLRRWSRDDFRPRKEDIFQERLYCIQWITKESLANARQETFFSSISNADLKTESIVEEYVKSHLSEWQARGLIPNMPIESGEETSRLIRERGWTYWHHLFGPRTLLRFALTREIDTSAVSALELARNADRLSKLCRYNANPQPTQGPKIEQTFSNQALNTMYNWGTYSSLGLDRYIDKITSSPIDVDISIHTAPASNPAAECDVWITDPPYADAVNYHEITEFFIAWLRGVPPEPLAQWTWDSRRPLAIKGNGEEFRHNMVAAYHAMSEHMPDNGLQIVMFTHQSGSVWADMAQIFWGAGLQVMAAWYIATETTSELKKGGYVQGTVILVLRKRKSEESGYKDEVVQEVRAEVAEQIDTMVGLNQTLRGNGRIENLFEDADLQMAGYAAALRVLTRYQRIDGIDMTKEALRKRRPDDKDLVGEVIDFAVQVANEHMMPEHMEPKLWERLTGPERFYFKMMDVETTSIRKLDNYQNFAKAFRVGDYATLMSSMEPNRASLKSARQFKKSGFESPEFGSTATRAALYAIYELENEIEGDDVLAHLRDLLPAGYHSKRDELMAIADYVARKRTDVDEAEARSARILYDLIRNERLG